MSHVVAFTGGGQGNSASYFVTLKPLEERRVDAEHVVARLRAKLGREPGASLYLQSIQDVRVGGRPAAAQYQYTVSSDVLADLRAWEPAIRHALTRVPGIVDVNSDQQVRGLQTLLVVDRDRASQLGVSMSQLDATLNDLYGQRQVSTITIPNQTAGDGGGADYSGGPDALKETYVMSDSGERSHYQRSPVGETNTRRRQSTGASPLGRHSVKIAQGNSISRTTSGSPRERAQPSA